MNSTTEEVCEDLNLQECDEVDVEISSAISKTWKPIIVGKPVALFYLDDDFLNVHLFNSTRDPIEVLNDLSQEEVPAEVLEEFSTSPSIVLHDPGDDFAVITNVQLTSHGLEDKED